MRAQPASEAQRLIVGSYSSGDVTCTICGLIASAAAEFSNREVKVSVWREVRVVDHGDRLEAWNQFFQKLRPFAAIPGSVSVNPVMLPPGWLRLCTIFAATGSVTFTNKMGTELVSARSVLVAKVLVATRRSGFSATSSCAKARVAVASPLGQRYSNCTFSPGRQPRSRSPRSKASTRQRPHSGVPFATRMPMRFVFWATDLAGRAATRTPPQKAVMTSRRLIRSPHFEARFFKRSSATSAGSHLQFLSQRAGLFIQKGFQFSFEPADVQSAGVGSFPGHFASNRMRQLRLSHVLRLRRIRLSFRPSLLFLFLF